MKLHYFNPGHEHAVLNGSPYYTPPANVVAMAADLSYLPAWYGAKGDCVLVDDAFDFSYYRQLCDFFPDLPKPVLKTDLDPTLRYEVDLWGISPQSLHFFRQLRQEKELNLGLPEWTDRYAYLNSRMAARDCLSAMIVQLPEISSTLCAELVSDMDQLREVISDKKYRWLVKAPFSSSGRGLLWIPAEGLSRTEEQILSGFFKKQKTVCAERVVEKTIDFAMEFMADGQGNVSFRGLSYFSTNHKGAYEGNVLCPQQTIYRLLADKVGVTLIDKVRQFLIDYLSAVYAIYYEGCIGVDMMIYEEEGRAKLHPCVEINMRCNMGLLSVNLFENYMHQDSNGKFQVYFDPQPENISLLNHRLKLENPLIWKDGKIVSGYLSLCPVTDQTKYVAYLLIERI